MSFSPAEITAEIRKHYPGFQVNYTPDFRQSIAESWSESIDDSLAKRDWDWQPKYDLESMTKDMLTNLKQLYQTHKLAI